MSKNSEAIFQSSPSHGNVRTEENYSDLAYSFASDFYSTNRFPFKITPKQSFASKKFTYRVDEIKKANCHQEKVSLQELRDKVRK